MLLILILKKQMPLVCFEGVEGIVIKDRQVPATLVVADDGLTRLPANMT